MKCLIVTADDFGLTPGVVEGIIEAHERGIVTATSLMVNAPAFERAAEWARRHESLAVGLHLVLTFGRPIGPPRALSSLLGPDGEFLRLDCGAHRAAEPTQVRDEVRAQLERFERGVGRRPTHIDGHHHVHALPGILAAVLDEAGRLDLPVRAPDEAARQTIREAKIATADRFEASFYGAGTVGEDDLLAILQRVPEGTTELMCHPSRPDPRLEAISSYSRPRYQELETLIADPIKDGITREGIELRGAAG